MMRHGSGGAIEWRCGSGPGDRISASPSGRVATVAISVVALFTAYFAASELGYLLPLGSAVGGAFWPPSGVALGLLATQRARIWPHLIFAGVAANVASDLLHGHPIAAALGFAVANLADPLIGAALLRAMFRRPIAFGRLSEVVASAIVAVVVSAPVAAVIGATAAELWNTPSPGFAMSWRTWWVGDAVGAIVLGPVSARLLLEWYRVRPRVRLWTTIEAVACTTVVVAVTQLVFSMPPRSFALPFLVFPALLWASLRFGLIGVGVALAIVVELATHGTASGRGPFVAPFLTLSDRLISMQIYVAAMALSFNTLAVIWEQRTRSVRSVAVGSRGSLSASDRTSAAGHLNDRSLDRHAWWHDHRGQRRSGPRYDLRDTAAYNHTSFRPSRRPRPGSHGSAILAGLRVLVVDDEVDIGDFIRRVLIEHGCVVQVARSANDALAVLARDPIDLLLADIGMPDVDGYELLRRARDDHTVVPPAIAITALARSEDCARCLAAGFASPLAKPIGAASLVREMVACARD